MGMTGKEIVETQKKYYLQSWAKQKDVNPIPMEKAEGIYLWDYDRRSMSIWAMAMKISTMP